MARTLLSIPIPKLFSFRAVLYSHGWSDLKPFAVSGNDSELRTVISLSPNKHALLSISHPHGTKVLAVRCDTVLRREDREAVQRSVRAMLRLDEPLDELYALCRKENHLRWIPRIRAGRMLRSATVFEDIVKMICTTNCSWSLTKVIVNRLTTTLGSRISDTVFSFPSPDAISARTERWLRKETSSGYRAPYLLEFARRIVSGSLSVEHLRTTNMPADELYRFLRSIKGVGHYAAGNLLKLLGHYDHLGLDSWIRSQYAAIYNNGRPASDAAIEKRYRRYGTWRGLVCWLDMTSSWHQ